MRNHILRNLLREDIEMRKNDLRTTVISKAAAAVLALALCLSFVLPGADLTAYAAADNTANAAADTTAATQAEQSAKVTADKKAKASGKKEVSATSISNYKTVINKSFNESLKIRADITPASGREVQLQRYSSSDDTWTTIVTVTAEKPAVSSDTNAGTDVSAAGAAANGEAKVSDTVRVSLSVPKEERMKTSSVWRIYVPATKTAAEAYSEKIKVTTRNLESPDLSARSACIYRIDANGKGTLIFTKKAFKKVAQASTTKLMTSILLIDSGLLDSTTTISNHAARTPWGSGRLAAGDVYNNRDLLFAMLLPSSNDAATAIAERVGGSEGGFVNMMNAKAEEMGLTNTHFCNPHGLDADGHYTTALELAKLTAKAYDYPEIRECWATNYKRIRSLKRGRSWNLWSTNAIFKYVSNFLGGKTGTESNAGCCFAGVYTYGGSTYVTVVLGSGYGFSRWNDTKKLHKYIQDYAATSY